LVAVKPVEDRSLRELLRVAEYSWGVYFGQGKVPSPGICLGKRFRFGGPEGDRFGSFSEEPPRLPD
jgi:hypothetical protein